jgi:hypothetical protein
MISAITRDMRLTFFSILALTFVAGTVVAADAPQVSVAIFDFQSPYPVRLRNDIKLVSSLLTADLSSNPRLTLVDRAELNKVLKEQAFGLSGDISPETAAKIGQLVGAKILVTGQIFSVGDEVGANLEKSENNANGKILIVANVIGAETGRIFAQREQGERGELVKMADDLSVKISETVTSQFTNLIAAGPVSTTRQIQDIISKLPARPRPSVSVQIDEQFLNIKKPGQTSQVELGALFKEAGFEVADEHSDKQPDILITGSATSSVNGKGHDGLISSSATLNVKAQERLTGKILILDRQDSTAVDLNRQMSAKKALQDAADKLAVRVIPVLAQ